VKKYFEQKFKPENFYCGFWPIGQNGQNLRIFFENTKNVILSGQNGNFTTNSMTIKM
jgi:hypothetical protein